VNGRIARPLIVAAALLVVACGSPGPSEMPSAVAPIAASSPDRDPVASPSRAATGDDEEAIAYAISQRKLFGLRSDEAWVRQVATDPRARTQLLDFPMLPEEEEAFGRLQASYDDMIAAVQGYAATRQDVFGGVWIDNEGHTIGTAWTTTPDIHRLAILASAGVSGPLEARLVRYSEKELRALQDRIGSDWDWLREIHAAPETAGVDIIANIAEVSISSANPLAPALILAHYGVPADMLRVVSDGTGILLRKRGTVHAIVLTADGKAPRARGLWPLWTPDRPLGSGDCGNETGLGVAPDGTFEIDCAPGGWTFEIRTEGGIAQPVIGRGHVVVPEGGDVSLTITLDTGAGTTP
jgi:hypothetical protein